MVPRKFPSIRCLALVAVSTAATGAIAQQQALSEQAYFEELPVVLSVSRLAQPIAEAPGAVTVIDREMIHQSGARQLVDLLRLVPGFQVAAASPETTTAVYHGLTESYPRHMQVLLDGRSQYSPFFVGGVSWNQIPVSLDDIERIEVVRGSNSAAYGSNAVLGVVNIVTRHALETQGASAELHAGTQGVNDKRIRVGAAGKDVAFRLTAETRRDAGLLNVRDDIGQRLIDGRIDWRLGMRDELQLQFGQISTDLQVGTGKAADPLRERKQSHGYVHLGWRRALGQGEDVTVRYYRSEEEADDAFSFPFAMFNVPVDYGFHSRRDDLEATHTFSPWRDTRLVWGGGVRTDVVRSPQFYGRADDVALTVSRLFGNLEWRFAPAWIANAGGTWEHDTNSKTTFAPRLAVNWHVSPGQTLRAGAARAYRTPSLFEQRGEWTVSTSTGVALNRLYLMSGNLRPESITSRELGWIGEFRPLRLTTDVRVFAERLADRVLAVPMALQAPKCELVRPPGLPCGDAFDAVNAQDVRIRGIEYQVRWQPFEATRIIANQTFIRIAADAHVPGARISPEYDPGKDVFQTANSAPTRATTLMLMQKLFGLELSATYSSVGGMKWSNNTYAKAWRRLDWRLGYPFRIGPTRGELAFTVQSDGTPHVEHADNSDKPWLGELVSTRSYATLRLDF